MRNVEIGKPLNRSVDSALQGQANFIFAHLQTGQFETAVLQFYAVPVNRRPYVAMWLTSRGTEEGCFDLVRRLIIRATT